MEGEEKSLSLIPSCELSKFTASRAVRRRDVSSRRYNATVLRVKRVTNASRKRAQLKDTCQPVTLGMLGRVWWSKILRNFLSYRETGYSS